MEILASMSETTLYTITGPLIFEELIPLIFKDTWFCFFIVKKNHVFILTQIIQVNIVFHRRRVILKFTPTHSDLSLDIQPADEHMTKDVLHYFFPLVHLYRFLILLHETISLLILLLRPHNNRSI